VIGLAMDTAPRALVMNPALGKQRGATARLALCCWFHEKKFQVRRTTRFLIISRRFPRSGKFRSARKSSLSQTIKKCCRLHPICDGPELDRSTPYLRRCNRVDWLHARIWELNFPRETPIHYPREAHKEPSASSTAFGFLAMTASKILAGPSGFRWPCSQF
jgi:hypothetical protein